MSMLALPPRDHDNLRCPCLARSDYACEPALTGAPYHDRVTHARMRFEVRPANSRRHRLVERGEFGRDIARDLVQRGVRIEVHVLGHSSPQRGRYMGRYETAGNDLRAWPSDAAMAAPQPRLDRDPVALLETPSARRLSADFLDHADRLMPRYDWQLQTHAVELAVVLVDVAAAYPARLDAHQGVVVANSRQLELLDLVAPVAHLYDGTCLRHKSSLPGIRWPGESEIFRASHSCRRRSRSPAVCRSAV